MRFSEASNGKSNRAMTDEDSLKEIGKDAIEIMEERCTKSKSNLNDSFKSVHDLREQFVEKKLFLCSKTFKNKKKQEKK